MMRYMLVLQFPFNGMNDYDKMIELEDELIKHLQGKIEVDGHDCGSGEMNIFIYTNEPQKTFDEAKVIIKAAGLLSNLSAAYRLAKGDEYTRLWPVDAAQPFDVA